MSRIGDLLTSSPPGVSKLLTPDSLAYSSSTMNTITINWLAVMGADPARYKGYTIQYKASTGTANWADVANSAAGAGSGTSGVSVDGTVSGIIRGLTAGTSYLIRVRANHPTVPAANSDFTAPITARTTAAPGDTKLDPPEARLIGSATSNTALIGVIAVTGATGYEIRHRLAGSETFTVTRVRAGLNQLLVGLTPDTAYLASARALASSSSNNSEFGDEVSFTTRAIAPPPPVVKVATPANLRSTAQTAHSITVACDAVTGARGYSFRYWETGKETIARFASNTSPSATITGLKASTTYRVQCRANGQTTLHNSRLSGRIDVTTRAATAPTPLPAMSVDISVSEPNLGLRFRFPGHPSVVPGTRIDVRYFIRQGSRVIKGPLTFVNTNGPILPGGAFTLQNIRAATDVRPPKYAYGTTYRVTWIYYVRGVGTGPSGSKNWSYRSRAGTSFLFRGSITGGRYNPRVGFRVRTGFESGVIGSVDRSSGSATISALYADAPRGARGASNLVLSVSGAPNWSVLTVGGYSYARTSAAGGGSSSGGRWSYAGGIPNERAAAIVTIK